MWEEKEWITNVSVRDRDGEEEGVYQKEEKGEHKEKERDDEKEEGKLKS